MARDFLRTMAEVAQRLFVTLGALGSWRAHGRGPRWIRVVGSIALPAPGRRGLRGPERIQRLAVCNISSATSACPS
jgi:hypothetical protein